MEVRNWKRTCNGMPSVLLFRRVMEEAATVSEGLEILEKSARVASNNLMLLDAAGSAAVAEMGPKQFKVRRPEEGILYATNYFMAGKARKGCPRFRTLEQFCNQHRGKIDLPGLQDVLDEVNQGRVTVQSMIFNPAALRIHLSMGLLPSSKGEYRSISFREALLGKAACSSKIGNGTGTKSSKQ
jgi:hypothetical protein